MSIAIGIGDLAMFLAEGDLDPDEIEEFEEVYRQLNRFLTARGYPEHHEPRLLPPIPQRAELLSFPSRFLHSLRRAYVHHRMGRPLAPLPDATDPIDEALAAEYERPRFVSHLVHFSDAEGFYLPVDLPEPLIAGPDETVLGGAVGSSVALRRELVDLAPTLDIPLVDGEPTDETAAQLGSERHQKSHPFGTEQMLWLIMFDAATQSLAHLSAIRLG
jgi:hypothetical protein